ncbi:DNA-binding response regulator, OmpR family, contains REC and winged-helix (wHTH) domain [Ekhidna lutea]|uniref:DNA-binding response regulator, OmpR family, contains REC and winged-helix (WHTH) domain n=1 Tax=Ekhidna lutea TaxID=447679 RepID=A0A239IEQ4_EKHLU|nr:response regulator transcription factor [Ekhidna lutea]SNS91738.1 DNA-binding response regulator, OmpR family, contains REC and winged-helix (wHTH) domain [Ekhidna lutea]
MAKILLAEDDQNLGFMIQDNLQSLNHEVTWCSDGSQALQSFKSDQYEICLLDVMMPKMDGFELAKNIRDQNEFIPILFLTAKSQEEDRLSGFEIGGDDYITKPFSMKELGYRIQVFLRRNSTSIDSPPTQLIKFGHSSLDTKNLVYSFHDQKQSLTQMEGKLLGMLVQNRNQLVKREDILETIWGENDYFKGRSLDVFITRLRKYLSNDSTLEIKNHHGVGFCLLISGT